MKVADEERNRPYGMDPGIGFFQASGLFFSFRVKDPHDTEDIMAGLPVNRKIIKTADIRKEGRVWRAADGRQVDLHLDTADIPELTGIDKPFSTFAVTF